MDEKQREWLNQFWIHFGLKEFLRLGLAISIWIFLSIMLAIAFDNTIYATIVFLTMFVLPFFAFRWKPAYSVYRKILGNENLPVESMPRSTVRISRRPRAWWSYLPGLWFSLLTFIVLYLAIRYLSR